MAAFFGVAGGMTALGPLVGGYLIEIVLAGDLLDQRAGRDHRGRADVMATPTTRSDRRRSTTGAPSSPLSGSARWSSASSRRASGAGRARPPSAASWSGWSSIALFVRVELRTPSTRSCRCGSSPTRHSRPTTDPVLDLDRLRADVPVRQHVLADLARLTASQAGLYIGIYFLGFIVAAQWGGRMLDKCGARPAVLLGCAVAAVGFFLWAQSMTDSRLRLTSGGGW